MKTLMFQGYSDDTFGEIAITNQDVSNGAENAPIQCVISSTEGALVVVGHYHIHPASGCWTIGISNFDEGIKLPEWPVRFKNGDCDYSPIFEIDVPDDFRLNWYSNGLVITAQ